ncbi:MAG: RdgB/HAM1 family non-canonical purine NTP pyrophosphatase [Planctomycetota bacterium]
MTTSTNRILVIGTANKHKVAEIAPVLLETGLPLELRSATCYGRFEPDETGSTLEENALIKAQAALSLSGEWAIADDTGLEVDALGGRPGIYAARYAGENCNFDDNIRKLLGELKDVPQANRTATFLCVIALCRPDAPPQTFRGECRGWISAERRGGGGFGYDPIFVVAELGKTFAEMSMSEKNRLSHRALAVKLCRQFIFTTVA